jgi:hypothetical protein
VSSLPKWWELQDRIDDAHILVYADYERYLSIRTRAVAILHDGVRKEIDLFAARGLDELEWTLKHAVNEIEAVGGVWGYALIYANEKGRELVFLAAINETEKGICALELKRKTGDELRDLRAARRDADRSFVEGLEWGGPRRKVDVKIRNYFRI